MRPTVAVACASAARCAAMLLAARAGDEDLELFLRLRDFALRDAQLRSLLIERLTTDERLLGQRREALDVALRGVAPARWRRRATARAWAISSRREPAVSSAKPALCGGDLRASDFALREQLGLLEVRELAAGGDLVAFANRDGSRGGRRPGSPARPALPRRCPRRVIGAARGRRPEVVR